MTLKINDLISEKENEMAEKIRDYAKLAQDIIELTGGEDNISSVTHCATRLRLVLNHTPEDANKKISALPGVVSVVEKGGQFQVVIGTHVTDVYTAVADQIHLDSKASGGMAAPKQSILTRVIGAMSGCMSPCIYLMAACGLLQGILIILSALFPSFTATGTYEVLNFMSWTPFTFLPVLIAVAGSKYFHCNTYIALLCCCALVNPAWGEIAARIADGESVRFLIFELAETTYTSSFLPPIIVVAVLAYLERFFNKVLPDVLKAVFTPLLCFLIMVPATLIVLGPVTSAAAHWIADAYGIFYDALPQLAALVFGGLWECLVIFGVHWTFTPIVLADYEFYGQCALQNMFAIAACCQMAACFAIWFKSRNKKTRMTAMSAGITGIFGITEPAVYGVTLPLKKPFICACIGGGVGSMIASFFNSCYFAYSGLAGVLTIPNAYNADNPSSIYGAVLGTLGGIILTFVLVMITGFREEPEEAAEYKETTENHVPQNSVSPQENGNTMMQDTTIYAPLEGECMPLASVNDPTFAQGVLGEGIAIRPSGGSLYSPVDGTVSLLAETGHAVGLLAENETELLIHVGLDTVTLEGKPFQAKVVEGAKVHKGDLLMEINWDMIQAAGLEAVTPVLVTGMDNPEKLEILKDNGAAKVGDPIIKITY